MEDSLFVAFANKLIDKTLMQELTWQPLLPMSEKDSHINYNLYLELLCNEFHQVNFENSFSLKSNNGYIYLIDEYSISGRDGTITDGINLYVQPTINSELLQILSNTKELYRLRNAIVHFRVSSKSAIEFIQSFLGS